MAERARIARHFTPLTLAEPGAFLLDDDAAVLSPPIGKHLVITTDSVIETIHVLAGATPQQFAQKLVRRNLSDLAAMGAEPWRYTLNLHTPAGLDDDWFAAFAATLADEQTRFGMALIGGDSTSGGDKIHTTMTCFGLTSASPLRRNGAHTGDDIYVSGTLGDAAYALLMLQQNRSISDALAARYHAPEPRLALGQKLCGIATAAMDISDGLLADLNQMCRTSNVGATVWRDALPLSPAVQHHADAWNFALSGGDDYELLFTAHPQQRSTIQSIATKLGVPLTLIGNINDSGRIALHDETGTEQTMNNTGWEHR